MKVRSLGENSWIEKILVLALVIGIVALFYAFPILAIVLPVLTLIGFICAAVMEANAKNK